MRTSVGWLTIAMTTACLVGACTTTSSVPPAGSTTEAPRTAQPTPTGATLGAADYAAMKVDEQIAVTAVDTF